MRKKMMKKLIMVMLVAALVFTSYPIGNNAVAKVSVKATSISSVTETANATVTIKWKKVAGVKGYIVYRKTGSGGNYKKLATIKKKTTTKYVDKTTKDGTVYYYSIKSYKGSSKSAYSKAKKIKTSKASQLESFYSDTMGLVVGKETKINFSATISNPNRMKKNGMAVYDGGILVGFMHDDGENGDLKANDGLYSLSYSITASIEGEEHVISCNIAGSPRESINIKSFNTPTQDDFDFVSSTGTEINKIAKEYLPKVVETEQDAALTLDKIEEKIKELEKTNEIIFYERNDGGILMQFASGIWCIYDVPVEGADAGSGDVQVRISTLQPYNSLGGDHALPTEDLDETATYLQSLGLAAFEKNLDDYDVTPYFFESIGSDELIWWNGHGGYFNNLGPYLCTNTLYYDQSVVDKDHSHIVERGFVVGTDGKICITPEYIRKHVPNVEHTLVILGACHTAEDDRLCSAFTEKGASVVGFSDTVKSYYDRGFTAEIVRQLSEKNGYKMYNSLEEAFEIAKKTVGENDKSFYYKDTLYTQSNAKGARPVLYGDKGYRLSYDSEATLSLSSDELSIKEGKTATITAKTNVDEKYIRWTYSNKDVVSVTGGGKKVKIKGKSAGQATITCYVGDIQKKCIVTVKPKQTRLGKTDLKNTWYNINYYEGKMKIINNDLYLYDSSLGYEDSNWNLHSLDKGDYVISLGSNYKIYYEHDDGEVHRDYQEYSAKEFNNSFYNKKGMFGLGVSVKIKDGKITDISLFS